jgi:hypothetical protein
MDLCLSPWTAAWVVSLACDTQPTSKQHWKWPVTQTCTWHLCALNSSVLEFLIQYPTETVPLQRLYQLLLCLSHTPLSSTTSLTRFFPFIYCFAKWEYTVAFIKVLTIHQIYHSWIHPLHHSPLTLPFPIPGAVLTGLIFPFTYMWIQYLHYINPPTHFIYIIPPPTSTPLPKDRIHSTLLFCDFCKRKKM